MQKAAQSSQRSNEERKTKNEELKDASRKFNRIYAFRVSRVNADYVCLKVWLLGGIIRARNIAVAELPALVEQIDCALADGCEVIALDGADFSAPEKVLAGIRNEFSYCCTGVSDANHVHGAGKAALPQSESLRSTKTKASAPATEQARYLSTPLCAKGGSDCTAPSASQVRSACGAGVAADVSAIRAGLAEMREEQAEFFENLAALLLRVAEVINEERKTKNELRRTSHSGARTRATVGAVISNEEPTDDETASQLGAAIRTKRGRTSVVVGVRKVAKFQPKTKGK